MIRIRGLSESQWDMKEGFGEYLCRTDLSHLVLSSRSELVYDGSVGNWGL